MNEMNEKMLFKIGVKFADSFFMGKNFFRCMECIYDKVPVVNYNKSIKGME